MTEENRTTLSIKRKPKIFVNPKHGNSASPASASAVAKPVSPKKKQKVQAPKPVKAAKPKQEPPKPVSKEERAAKRAAEHAQARDELIKLWPNLFSKDNPKPLKVDISKDLFAARKRDSLDISKRQISIGLMVYTQNEAYQRILFEVGPRFDINGQPCGEVTEEQAARARDKAEKLKIESDKAAPSD